MRVTRGGEDSLFVFVREASPRPMLTLEQREALYREGRIISGIISRITSSMLTLEQREVLYREGSAVY